MSLLQWIEQINKSVNSVIWGPVLLIILAGSGIYFTLRTGFFQLRKTGRFFAAPWAACSAKTKLTRHPKTSTPSPHFRP